MNEAFQFITDFALNLPLSKFLEIIRFYKEIDFYTYDAICSNITHKFPYIRFDPQSRAAGMPDGLELLKTYQSSFGPGLEGGPGDTRALLELGAEWNEYINSRPV